mgnify:CR=1 FL=1
MTPKEEKESIISRKFSRKHRGSIQVNEKLKKHISSAELIDMHLKPNKSNMGVTAVSVLFYRTTFVTNHELVF